MSIYCKGVRRAVPVLSQGETDILVEIIDNDFRPMYAIIVLAEVHQMPDLLPVRFIAILIEFEPSDFLRVVTEYRVPCCTLFPRCQLSRLRLAQEVNDIDLEKSWIQSQRRLGGIFKLTFCLVCHAGGSFGSLAVYTI